VREVCTHRGPNDLRVPEVHGARQRDRRRRAESGGGAEDRSYVAWILDRVEHEQSNGVGGSAAFERAIGDLRDGENPLWRLGLCGASKFRFIHRGVLDASLGDLLPEVCSTLRPVELRRRENSTDRERRAKQLFHRPNPFHDEEGLTLARFSATEVAGKCEELHRVIRGSNGMGLAF
jgi:hypothetical protein